MVVRRAEGVRVGLQLLVSADELDRVDLGDFSGAAAQQDEEVGVAVLRGLAEVNRAEVLEFFFVVGDGSVGLDVSSR